MNSFHDNIMFSPNIRDGGSNVFFDTCVRYNEHSIRTIREVLVDVLKFIEMSSSCFDIFAFYYIEEKVIRKDIK